MKVYDLIAIPFHSESLITRIRLGELVRTAQQLSATPRVWAERGRYRSEIKRLLNVGPHMIRDVGLVWEDAQREAQKPFWQE